MGGGGDLREYTWTGMGVEGVHLGHGWELREHPLDMGGS